PFLQQNRHGRAAPGRRPRPVELLERDRPLVAQLPARGELEDLRRLRLAQAVPPAPVAVHRHMPGAGPTARPAPAHGTSSSKPVVANAFAGTHPTNATGAAGTPSVTPPT